MRFFLVSLSLAVIGGASAAAKPNAAETAARKLLVQRSPIKGVHPAKTLAAVSAPVLAKRYPNLRIFAAEHDTDFFEYMHVKSLAVVGPGSQRAAVVEMLFSADGWKTLLGRFKGAAAENAAGAEELVGALRDLLGPRVWPIDFKPAAATHVPVPQGSRFEVTLATRAPRRAVLVVSFDASFHLTSAQIDNRLQP